METTLSVIIPVYNTGDYLEKCISSICNQSLEDIEIIVVDDGSEEFTAQLCDKLATRDSRIRVVHKKNEGVSVARNTGISLASGRYMGFVDSDDWISPDMYKCLIEIAEKEETDIVMCDAITVRDGNKNKLDTFTLISESGPILKPQISPNQLCEVAGAAWRCIYNCRFIADHHIEFPIGVKFSEDRIFNIRALGYSRGFYYLKQPLYYRYVRNGSAAFSYHPDAVTIITNAHRQIDQLLLELWSGEYQNVYQWQELALFYGAMNAIYLPNGLSALGRYRKMNDLCNDEELHRVISLTKATDIRARLIRGNHVFLLCILTFLIKLKHTLFFQ